MTPDEILRTDGFVPGQICVPGGVVHSRLTTGGAIGQWLGLLLIGVPLLVFPFFFLHLAKDLTSWIFFFAWVSMSGYVVYHASHDINEWVEMDDRTLRWKH